MTEQPATVDQSAEGRPRVRRRWPLVAGVAGLVVVLGVAGWLVFLRPTGYDVAGRLALPTDAFSGYDADSCTGKDRFADIAAGTEVVVSDAAGTTVAVSRLTGGRIEFATTGVPRLCIFSFTAQVPKGGGFYGVTVRNRGTVTFPEAEIADGTVDLTLGT